MISLWFQKLTLALAGLTALVIGLTILLAPNAFYAFYALELGPEPTLRSDLRATAGGLTLLGGLMLSGVMITRLRWAATALAGGVFFAYAGGRLLSLALDGAPHPGMVDAALIELALGLLCGVSLWLQSRSPAQARAFA